MTTVERIHYYSDYDMSIPMHIERMADVVRSYEEEEGCGSKKRKENRK